VIAEENMRDIIVTIKKPILLGNLGQLNAIDKAIIESLDQALYRLVIEVGEQQYYVLETPSKSLTRHSIIAIQELLAPFNVGAMYLQHQSPYDEMIGQEERQGSNTLLVPVGNYFESRDHAVH
jgi:hypothetical protein